MWPDNDYFNAYKAYSSGSEAPEMFHKWVALAMISASIGRRCWLDMSYFHIFPNVYFVLIGPPATMKSTAMGIGTSMIRKLDVPEDRMVHFSGDSVTRERLIMDLSASMVVDENHLMDTGEYFSHSSFTIQCSELEVFLGQKDRDMVKFLTDLFDCPDEWTYKTKTQGEDLIKAPCVTMLAGATPQDIPEIFDEASIGTGLTSRMLFIYAAEPGAPVPIPKMTENQKLARDKIKYFLRKIPEFWGEIKMEPAAEQFYSDWYMARARSHKDQRIAGYWARKHVHMMKIAMLLALSELRKNITTGDIETALAMLDEIEPGLIQTFASVGANKGMVVMESVIAAIRAQGKDGFITYAQVLRDHLHTLDARRILDTLTSACEAGRLVSEQTSIDGKRALIYRLGAAEQKG